MVGLAPNHPPLGQPDQLAAHSPPSFSECCPRPSPLFIQMARALLNINQTTPLPCSKTSNNYLWLWECNSNSLPCLQGPAGSVPRSTSPGSALSLMMHRPPGPASHSSNALSSSPCWGLGTGRFLLPGTLSQQSLWLSLSHLQGSAQSHLLQEDLPDPSLSRVTRFNQ